MTTNGDPKSDAVMFLDGMRDQLVNLQIALDQVELARQRALDALTTRRFMIEGIPYLSQLGPDADFAPGDCGPASMAMVLRHQTGIPITVDQVSEATGNPEGFRFTNNMTLIRTARKWDVSMYWARHLIVERLIDELNAGRPVIALVHYPSLPIRYDPKYPYSHFIVLVGYDDKDLYYHDPYFPGDGGNSTPISHSEFNIAWSNVTKNGNSARQCLRIRA